MPSDVSVPPLRISKNTPSSTPQKMAPSNRALSEISAGSMRRNSPSYNQATKKMLVSRDTSPYTENTITKPTKHDFWSARDPAHVDAENSFTESIRSPSPSADASPRRRPSVERLQMASRVKNSKIFEMESKTVYDPLNMPVIERPAANRPLSQTLANNSFTRFDSLRKENNPISQRGHKRSETEISIPYLTPTKSSSPSFTERAGSPATGSPTKSSLSRTSQFSFHNVSRDSSQIWSDEERCSTPRALHRHNKSVTFESNPPMINEYENPTPEPSVTTSNHGSRDNSVDSDDFYDEGDSYERGDSVEQDDSFDEDLENADKTPVVLPEHWSRISAEEVRKNLIDDEDDVFESSVIHTAPVDLFRRSVSVASDGSARPLPPLPGMLRKKESQRMLVPERAEAEELIVRNLDTGETKELRVSINDGENQDESVVAELEEFAQSPPRISRESILAKVRGSKYDFNDEDEEDQTFADATENAYMSYSELARLDPDQPIPSRETSHETAIYLDTTETVETTTVEIKQEFDVEYDLSAIPAAESTELQVLSEPASSPFVAEALSDEGSRYSPTDSEINQAQAVSQSEHGEPLHDAMALLTVKDYAEHSTKLETTGLELPQYSNDWSLGMDEYCTPEKTEDLATNAFLAVPIITPTTSLAEEERESTPDSVIRRASNPVSDLAPEEIKMEEVTQEVDNDQYDGLHRPVSPVIPERRATIKTGGKLKTRPSGTPADFEAIFAAPIDLETNPLPESGKLDLSLEVPHLEAADDGDMLGLDRAFDRVIEGQKKGYLTRQNTKIVIATTRNVSGESNDSAKTELAHPVSSPRKPSAEQHFKAEPWNGKQRRRSLRNASLQQGPAPPLPGQPSALGVVNEDRSLVDDDAEIERGRLFIKVVGVQNLDMPLPRSDHVDFRLTLDNGLHCVTTGALELARTASIGQEFELVVQNDLDFQLTLSTQLPPPVQQIEEVLVAPSSPSKSTKSTFSKFLSSPKKRAEKERQEREAQEAEDRRRREELMRKRASVQPTAWDLMRELVNQQDGSFARAYVNLAEHEHACFGRKLEVDVPLYNEWALEKDDAVVNSVRSKRGANWGPIRRPPYVIGHLRCQLLYVPKPKDAADDDLPKSMSAAVREISKASEVVEVAHEGFLSQQGGDCVHWRRRFFSVTGSKLTAYHEHTHQKRAVINLTKASRLVDDKSTLVADPSGKSKGGRRKSAFAEEDEGYQYVEEGFRIRFANGETIDFYADSRAEKDVWMETLGQVVGKPDQGTRKQNWTDLVLTREKSAVLTTKQDTQTINTTEVRDFVQAQAPPPPAKDEPASSPIKRKEPTFSRQEAFNKAPPPAKRASTPPLQPRSGHRKRDAVKSMIF